MSELIGAVKTEISDVDGEGSSKRLKSDEKAKSESSVQEERVNLRAMKDEIQEAGEHCNNESCGTDDQTPSTSRNAEDQRHIKCEVCSIAIMYSVLFKQVGNRVP